MTLCMTARHGARVSYPNGNPVQDGEASERGGIFGTGAFTQP